MEGYIKLDRKLMNWQWADNPHMLALWIHILLQANYQDNLWHGELYERGSFPTSVEKLSIETGLSISQIRTGLKRLQEDKTIEIKTTNKKTKIIAIKYGFYQDGKNKITNKSQTNHKQIATLKERNKEINIIKEKNIKKEKPFDCVENKQLKEALMDFRLMRQKIKSPLTSKAEDIILNKLSRLSNSPKESIEIINQSIVNSWKSIYPLLPEKQTTVKRNDDMPVYDSSENPTFTKEMKERLIERRKNEIK